MEASAPGTLVHPSLIDFDRFLLDFSSEFFSDRVRSALVPPHCCASSPRPPPWFDSAQNVSFIRYI